MSFYGGEKTPIKLEEEMFDSIEELGEAMPEGNMDDLMTSAIHTAEETMYSFAATYYLSVGDPRYNTVANLALLNMTCSFMYEIGYIDDSIKTLFDYYAKEYVHFEGINVSNAVDMDIGTGISTGSKLNMSSEQFPISARRPKGKRVKYNFRNLSTVGRANLKLFEEIEAGILDFINQWIFKNKAEMAHMAIQLGLQSIPYFQIFQIGCAAIPFIGQLEKMIIKTRYANISLTAFCAILTAAPHASRYVLTSREFMSRNAANTQNLLSIKKFLPGSFKFLLVSTAQEAKNLLPLAAVSVNILYKIWSDFQYVFKPQNKAAWIDRLVGGNGNPSDIDERMLVFEKHSSLVETFKSNKSVVEIDETSKFFEDHEDNIRKFQLTTATANKTEINRIEGNREENKRDYYEKEEIDSIGDMLSESTKIVELVDEAILKSETAFTKILAIDDGLDRFEKFKDAYLKLNQRSNNERLNFKRAAGNLFTRLKNLDFGDDSTTSECIEDIYGKMKTLDDYTRPLHGPLNRNEIAFVNSLSNDAVVGCPRIAQGAQGRGHGGNDDDDDDDDDGGGDDDPHVPGLGAVDGDNRDGVDGVDGDPPNRSGVRGKRQAQSSFRRVQSELLRLDNHGKRAARRTNRATIVDEIVDRFRVTRF